VSLITSVPEKLGEKAFREGFVLGLARSRKEHPAGMEEEIADGWERSSIREMIAEKYPPAMLVPVKERSQRTKEAKGD
jgi:hypothetical protein